MEIEEKKVLTDDEKVLAEIKKLIPQASTYWIGVIAKKMGKSHETIKKYARGERGMRSGCHKEVLRYLIDLVEKEKEKTRELLARVPKDENTNQ